MVNPMIVLGVGLIILAALIGIPILWLLVWFLVIDKKLNANYFYPRSRTTEKTLPNGQKIKITEIRQRDKTFWDWQQLLLIPLVLTLLTVGFSFAQNTHNEQLALDQQQQTTLENYINQMSDLLLSNNIDVKLYDSKSTDQVRMVARARTLIALSKLDPERKRSIVLFLYQADLITWHKWSNMSGPQFPVVNLTYADLSSADLSALFLTNADLELTLLNNANLSNTLLDLSDLGQAALNGANLSSADLRGASLHGANLQGADLSAARLQIYTYNLPLEASRDTNLSGANLSGADLKGATMSNGSKHR